MIGLRTVGNYPGYPLFSLLQFGDLCEAVPDDHGQM